MLSKEKSMENFEIVKDYYNWQNDPRREAANGVSPDDQYTLAGRSYRAIPYGAEVGLFTNRNATEADRLSAKFPSYEGDSVEGKAKGAFFDGDIVRWKSNGRIPFGDMLLDFYLMGYISKEQMIKSAVLQEKGNDEFWEEITENGKTGCDELIDTIRNLLESCGGLLDTNVTMDKYEVIESYRPNK